MSDNLNNGQIPFDPNFGDTSVDAYSVPTKNMPGYDEQNHWIGFQSAVERDEAKYGKRRKGRGQAQIGNKNKSDSSGQSSGRKGEPNWGNKKKEPNWSSKHKKDGSTGMRKAEPTLHKKKPEPKLLRDTSSDLARITGNHKHKNKREYQEEYDDEYNEDEFSTDDISPIKKNTGRTLFKKKSQPKLLRDTSNDTARLSWAKGAEKISPLIKQKKGMTLVSKGKTGRIVSNNKDAPHIHTKKSFKM